MHIVEKLPTLLAYNGDDIMIDLIYQSLAEIGFHHPLHPAIVHLPMGLIMGGFLFGIGSAILNNRELTRTAHHCFTLALIFILPTILLGYTDWQYKFDAEWSLLILLKIIFAFVLFIMLASAYWVGRKNNGNIKLILLIYALCLINTIALGFMGGEIQYG